MLYRRSVTLVYHPSFTRQRFPNQMTPPLVSTLHTDTSYTLSSIATSHYIVETGREGQALDSPLTKQPQPVSHTLSLASQSGCSGTEFAGDSRWQQCVSALSPHPWAPGLHPWHEVISQPSLQHWLPSVCSQGKAEAEAEHSSSQNQQDQGQRGQKHDLKSLSVDALQTISNISTN
jgi:hypothetical protein